ncbi:MAG: hypothetical protein ABJD24_05740 [Acidimicrobiales bacterium]
MRAFAADELREDASHDRCGDRVGLEPVETFAVGCLARVAPNRGDRALTERRLVLAVLGHPEVQAVSRY